MKDEHTYSEKMARIGRNTVIYKGTFVSNQALVESGFMSRARYDGRQTVVTFMHCFQTFIPFGPPMMYNLRQQQVSEKIYKRN